jgi:DNA primase
LELGLRFTVLLLPYGHDPDSFLKSEGADAYRRRLDEAPAWMDWLIRRAAADHAVGTPDGKAAFLNDLLPSLTKVASAVERAAWLERAIDRGALDPAAARHELRRAFAHQPASGPAAHPPAPPPGPRPAAGPLLPAERWLVALLLQEDETVGAALAELTDEEVEGLRSAPVLRAARDLAANGGRVTVAALQAALPEEECRRLVTELAVGGAPDKGASPGECVRELKRRPLQARMAQIQRDLSGASGSRVEELLEEKLHLRRRMTSL